MRRGSETKEANVEGRGGKQHSPLCRPRPCASLFPASLSPCSPAWPLPSPLPLPLTFLSSSAWFCSASVSVVATVSTSTVSHSRRSQILQQHKQGPSAA